MPSRNYCDLCDILIDKSVSIYALALAVSKDTEPYSSAGYHELYDGLKKIYIPIELNMVCPKCIGKIRLFIERLKEDAIQERKTEKVPLDEETGGSQRVREERSTKKTIAEETEW